jgi:hypothetical protein
MKIDKAGEYRTSSGQMVDIYTIFAGSAYGYFVTEGGATVWRAEDGIHPTQAELRIVGKWGEELQVQHEQTIESLRQRINAAVKALQDITRGKVYADNQFRICYKRNEQGQPAQRDDVDDVVEILAQTLERLQQLQRYKPRKDRTGDFLKVEDVLLDAIKDLRRAMGDCTLDEEVQR